MQVYKQARQDHFTLGDLLQAAGVSLGKPFLS